MVRGVANLLGDVFVMFLVVADLADPAVILDGDARDVREAPGGDLAVPVLADDVGVHVAGVDAAMPAEHELEPGAVEHGARSDHALPRPAEPFEGDVGQRVDRVGDHHDDGLARVSGDLVADRADDPGVLADQVRAGLPRLLLGAGGDDDHAGVGAILVRARLDVHRRDELEPVRKVHDFAFDPPPV